MSIAQTEVERWADQFERSFHGGAWHGPALEEALQGISATAATVRPAGAAHSVLELVHHVAYWLETAQARMCGQSSSEGPADWAPAPAGEAGWQAARARLAAAHAALHGAILDLAPEALDRPVAGSDPTLRGMLFGVLQHNAYHAGQIVALGRWPAGGSR